MSRALDKAREELQKLSGMMQAIHMGYVQSGRGPDIDHDKIAKLVMRKVREIEILEGGGAARERAIRRAGE